MESSFPAASESEGERASPQETKEVVNNDNNDNLSTDETITEAESSSNSSPTTSVEGYKDQTTTLKTPATPELALPEPANHDDAYQLPELGTKATDQADDLIAALRLVADSVAQQRQIAAKSVMCHPWYIITLLVLFSVIFFTMYDSPSDWPMIIMTLAGTQMASMMGVKMMVDPYLEAAEKTGKWVWLYGNSGMKTPSQAQFMTEAEKIAYKRERDVVIVTQYDGEVIGTVVLRFERLSTDSPVSKYARPSERCLIRAWTVKQRYRGNGVGTVLLVHAVHMSYARTGDAPLFANNHAHSIRVLPAHFNARIKKLEKLAHKQLASVISSFAKTISRRPIQIEQLKIEQDATSYELAWWQGMRERIMKSFENVEITEDPEIATPNGTNYTQYGLNVGGLTPPTPTHSELKPAETSPNGLAATGPIANGLT